MYAILTLFIRVMHLVSTEPNLTEFLLNLVAQSRDRLPDTLFPLKKVYVVMQ